MTWSNLLLVGWNQVDWPQEWIEQARFLPFKGFLVIAYQKPENLSRGVFLSFHFCFVIRLRVW